MTPPPSAPVRVAALYRFATIDDCAAVRDRLEALCRPDVRGTLLVAHEGLNGTIAGPAAAIDRVLAGIRALPGFARLDVKFADAAAMPVANAVACPPSSAPTASSNPAHVATPWVRA